MQFNEFAALLTARFHELAHNPGIVLVKMNLRHKNELWEAYLDAFPAGTNEIFRVNRKYDASYDKSYIRAIGHAFAVDLNPEDGIPKLLTIWDNVPEGHYYGIVARRMRSWLAERIHHRGCSVLHLKESSYGRLGPSLDNHDYNLIWESFHTQTPPRYTRLPRQNWQTDVSVLRRGLSEISDEAIQTVLQLIDDTEAPLYRGKEFRSQVEGWWKLAKQFDDVPAVHEDYWILTRLYHTLPSVFGVPSSVIGTLLKDISAGIELTDAVRMFESKVAPTNYKRTTAPIGQTQVKAAQAFLEEKGLKGALNRRLARADDLPVNEVLWLANTDKPTDALAALVEETGRSVPKNQVKGAQDISMKDFIETVLPKTKILRLKFDATHVPRLMALTRAQVEHVPGFFAWDNDWAWTYRGGVADVISERVKRAGGQIEGQLRISLAWSNGDDLDLHLRNLEDMEHLYFANRRRWGGMLDVDENAGSIRNSTDPVENIIFPTITAMPDGLYIVGVHNFAKRMNERVGFKLQIAIEGQETVTYAHEPVVPDRMMVNCIMLEKEGNKVSIKEVLKDLKQVDNDYQSGSEWNLDYPSMIPVKAVCLSPNYWNQQSGKGNLHTFFLMEGVQPKEDLHAYYPEYLNAQLHEHRRTLEALANRTKLSAEGLDDVLGGVGFSETVKASVVLEVTDTENKRRYYKVNI